jgi:hypothetical protein
VGLSNIVLGKVLTYIRDSNIKTENVCNMELPIMRRVAKKCV